MAQIHRKLRAGKSKKPMERYLLFFMFTGHGLLTDGMQNLIFNDYDPKTNFYKMYRAEAKIRSFAETYPNSYVIGIFACSRSTFDHTWMKNQCISLEQFKNITSEKGSEKQLLEHHQNLFKEQQDAFSKQYTTCLSDIETSFKRRIIEASSAPIQK